MSRLNIIKNAMRQLIKEANIIHVKERTQCTKADAEVFQVSELPDRDFKITIISVQKECIICVNR